MADTLRCIPLCAASVAITVSSLLSPTGRNQFSAVTALRKKAMVSLIGLADRVLTDVFLVTNRVTKTTLLAGSLKR